SAGTIDATGGTLTLTTGNTIENAGLLEATKGGTLDVQDAEIHNTGTGAHGIFVDGTSELLVDTTTLKLTGGGHVSLASGSHITAELVDSGAIVTLDNVDNTIEGAGHIGNGDTRFAITNEAHGTIDADVSGAVLSIDTANQTGNSSTLHN